MTRIMEVNGVRMESSSKESAYCPICAHDLDSPPSRTAPGEDGLHYTCLTCGNFAMSRTLVNSFGKYDQKAYILSGYIANLTRFPLFSAPDDIGILPISDQEVVLHTGNIDQIIDSVSLPRNPDEMIDRLLIWVSRACWRVNYSYVFDSERDYSLIYAQSPEELDQIIEWAVEYGLLKRIHESKTTPIFYKLSREGWKHVRELEAIRQDNDQAFVAMWFDPSIQGVYIDGIKPALEEMGYRPIRIDRKEFDGKIDDEIVAEIRRSSLLIADFTSSSDSPGGRAGVYYESGFAAGLGIRVIRAVRDDQIGHVHFDTRQYNHIVWKDAIDLRTKLMARIGATIPGRANMRKEKA